MWPDRISNPRPLALESDALPTANAARLVYDEISVHIGLSARRLYVPYVHE